MDYHNPGGWVFFFYFILLFLAVDPQSLLQRPLNVNEPSEVVQRSQHQAIGLVLKLKFKIISKACVSLLVHQNVLALYFAASSSEIRDALKDEDLRKLVCAVDSSQDPENVSSVTYLIKKKLFCLSNTLYDI